MARRRMTPMRYPVGVEYKYRNTLLKLVTQYARLLKKHLSPIVVQMVLEVTSLELPTGPLVQDQSRQSRNDGWEEDLNGALGDIADDMTTAYPQAIDEAWETASLTNDFNLNEWKTLVRSQYGVDPTAEDPERWNELLEDWGTINTDLIRDIPTELADEIRDEVVDALQSGRSQRDMATAIYDIMSQRVEVAESRARLIARDQVAKLNGNFTQQRQQDLGVDQYIWRTVGDERVRESHNAVDGRLIDWSTPPAETDDNHPGEDINCRCVADNSQITFFNGAEKAFRRRYAGKLTKLVTRSGKTLRLTSNHPVLTPDGWKAANRVEVGDQLIKVHRQVINGPTPSIAEQNEDHVQASAADIFDALSVLFQIFEKTITIEEFHGDGIANQPVEIVRANLLLRDSLKARLSKLGGENVLTEPGASTGSSSFDRSSQTLEMASTLGNTTDSGISSQRLRSALFWRERGTDARSHQVASLKQAINLLASNREILGNSMPSKAFLVELDDVLDQSLVDYSGHVYNFQTDVGAYLAEGFIVQNCWAEPVLPEVAEFEAELLEAGELPEEELQWLPWVPEEEEERPVVFGAAPSRYERLREARLRGERLGRERREAYEREQARLLERQRAREGRRVPAAAVVPTRVRPTRVAPTQVRPWRVTHAPGVSDAFLSRTYQGLWKVPPHLQDVLIDKKVQVKLGRNVTDVVPSLKGERPAGYREGSTFAQSEGVHLQYQERPGAPRQNVIVLGEYKLNRQGQEVPTRGEPVLMHEVGHALDQALGNVSSKSDIKRAYAKDYRAMPEVQKGKALAYYTQENGGARGRAEAFAEVFAREVVGEGTSRLDIREYFPNTTDAIRKVMAAPEPSAAAAAAPTIAAAPPMTASPRPNKAERDALLGYTGGKGEDFAAGTGIDFRYINRTLREGGELTDDAKDAVQTIDNWLDRQSLKNDTTLYRGMSGRHYVRLDDLPVGTHTEDLAFQSTSLNQKQAAYFNTRWQLRHERGENWQGEPIAVINAPAGSKAAQIPRGATQAPREQEVLLARDSKLRFDGIQDGVRDANGKLWREYKFTLVEEVPGVRAASPEDPLVVGRLKVSKERAYTGTREATEIQLTKSEQGKIGEEIITKHLKRTGLRDARTLNVVGSNFPVDLAADHELIEVKAGLVSNGPSAQGWKVSIGEPGKAEKERIRAMTPEQKAAYNVAKMDRIMARKDAVVEKYAEDHPGSNPQARTFTTIINPETRTVDIYAFEGFHRSIRWKSKLARESYVGSYTY